MAKFQELKKKRKSRLEAPPLPELAGNNLDEPETAPAGIVDRRTLKTTGRTEQFATRVRADFKKRFREIAARDGLKIVELLEKSLDAYEEKQQSKR